MFEDPEWDRRRVALLDAPDESDLPPWEDDRPAPTWEAADETCHALAAADPERLRTPAEVLADAQAAPMSAELFGGLAAIEPARLDDAGRVALAAAWQRVSHAALARRADAVAALARTQPGNDWVDGVRCAGSEIAPALALGTGTADLLVTSAVLLSDRLTETLALARRGDLAWDKAVALAQATAQLSDEQARAVERRVLPRAVGRTLAQHREAVRRAVDRVDPDGARRRREQARADVRLIATHHGAGMGELFASLPSEQLDTVYLAADCHARAAKATGDPRPLDELRIAALVGWAQSYLAHGDPLRCGSEQHDIPAPATSRSAAYGPARPTRHGRPAVLRVMWDLTSLLGVTDHPGELAASGATLPAAAMRELLGRGAHVRRLLIDAESGELLDLTPRSWRLPGDRDGAGAHLPPVQLQLIVDTRLRDAILTGDLDRLPPAQRGFAAQLADLLPLADPVVAQLLAYPVTADALDADPDAEHPSPALAEFIATRDRHPVNPAAGTSDAAAADLDHTVARSAGGTTTRDNLASLTRRWHLARTHGGWTYRRVDRHWEWTSPTGLTYRTRPYDYRLGP